MTPRQLPYNTGKVKIGSAYTPPVRCDFTQDEERIQTALIGYPDLTAHIALKGYIGILLFCALTVLVVVYANH